MEYLKIDLIDKDIQVISKIQWKRYVHEKAKIHNWKIKVLGN